MKGKHPYAEGLAAALSLRAKLQPFCERIEVAGSIRRRCETVGDIEIVAIPRMQTVDGLFGPMGKAVSLLDEHLAKYPEIYRQVRAGERMKEMFFEGYQVDLFLCTPERWGVIFTLRTGSADFSKWLVTSRTAGGGRLPFRYVEGGQVWGWGKRMPFETPEEEDVFEALGVAWVPLELRHRGYWGEGRPGTDTLTGTGAGEREKRPEKEVEYE